MPAALKGVTWLGREGLDGAAVQDQLHVVGERSQQPPVLPGRPEALSFPRQLVMEPDQVGRHRLQEHSRDAVPQPLVLLVQPVDHRFPMRGTPVRLRQVLLYPAQACCQLAKRLVITRIRGSNWRHFCCRFFHVAARAGLLVGSGWVQITVGQGESPPYPYNTIIPLHDTLASSARTQSDGRSARRALAIRRAC